MYSSCLGCRFTITGMYLKLILDILGLKWYWILCLLQIYSTTLMLHLRHIKIKNHLWLTYLFSFFTIFRVMIQLKGEILFSFHFAIKFINMMNIFGSKLSPRFTLVLYSIISLHLPTLISPLKSLYNIQQYQIFLRVLIKFHSTLNQILQRDEQIQQWLNVIFFSHLK